MAPKKKPTVTAAESTTDTPALTGRVLACLQSSGRMGKSTFMDLFLSWCDHAEIEWRGLDFDGTHQTLSRAYPNVHLMPLSEDEAIPRLVDALGAEDVTPITALDFPAQATDELLRDFEAFGVMEVLEAKGMRLTVPLFLLDDQSARESMAKVLKAFGSRCDYIFVRNSVKGKSSGVEGTAVVAAMLEKGVPVIDLPVLTQRTRDAMTALTKQERRFFPLAEMRDALPMGAQLELQKFLPKVWMQMEAAAGVLLPDVGLIQRRVSAVADARDAAEDRQSVDPYDV